MAKVSALTVFLLAGAVVMYAPSAVYGGSSPAPNYVEPQEPKQLWDECLIKLTPKCALDIIEDVFGNGSVSDQCCSELVKEGRLCHDTLIKYIAERPSFRDHAIEYEKKSDELWSKCVSLVKID